VFVVEIKLQQYSAAEAVQHTSQSTINEGSTVHLKPYHCQRRVQLQLRCTSSIACALQLCCTAPAENKAAEAVHMCAFSHTFVTPTATPEVY
jgi:hypothetical protein